MRAFEFYGGVPQQIVCDNLKSAITKACFHEPVVNQTYQDLARHYKTAVVPARPYKPKDKAKAEVGVQVVQRWIVARLRKRRFLSLAELNAAIRDCLTDLNNRQSRHLGASRRQLFDELEVAHLVAETGAVLTESQVAALTPFAKVSQNGLSCRRYGLSR